MESIQNTFSNTQPNDSQSQILPPHSQNSSSDSNEVLYFSINQVYKYKRLIILYLLFSD